MKCGKSEFSNFGGSSRWVFSLDMLPVLLIRALLMHGMMPVWSQDNNPKSNNFNDTSQTFELSLEMLNKLHNQASNQLIELTQNLNQALQELQTSKDQSMLSQYLLNNALQRSTDLESTNQKILEFNQQIGERIQERDEDLANSYNVIDAKDKQILKMWITIIALGLACLGFIAFGVIKLLIKLHIL
jgi:cell division protein ZapA (FtsZ GTPase activity inhibitor)